MPSMKELGERIEAARIKQRYSLKSAAEAAAISRDTWRKIEEGASVHDTKRQAALDLLGLDSDGLPVSGQTQDAHQFVEAPGGRVESGVSNEDLLREILRSRADQDQIAAGQREHQQTLEQHGRTLESLSERVAALEESRP